MRADYMCGLIVQLAFGGFHGLLGSFAAAWRGLAAGDWFGALIQNGKVTLVDE
jgi:hypothetical protein